jgi:hypothetical protein
MSITSYSELQTAIGNWLDRDDLTSYIPDFITLAEKRIYRECRLRCMEVALNSTIASGVIAVPSTYVELKHAYIDGSPTSPLQRRTAQWIYEHYPTRSADGKPAHIARDVDSFIFAPYPDSGYVVKGTYYQSLTALSTSLTNWFTANAPGLLLFAALCEAEPFLKNDDRLTLWETKYQAEKNALVMAEKQEQFSGSPLSVSFSVY